MSKILVDLSDRQLEAYDDFFYNDKSRFILYGGAAGGGKSWLICVLAIVITTGYRGTRVMIGREERTKLMRTTFQTFWKVIDFLKMDRKLWYWNSHQSYIEYLPMNSRIDWMELRYLPQDPNWNRIGSLELTAAFIEEAQTVPFKAFDVLKPRVNRQYNQKYGIRGKILLGANPEKNWLYTTFIAPSKSAGLGPLYTFVPAFYRDNPFLDQDYGEMLDSIDDEVTKQRLRDGNWDFNNDINQLIYPEFTMNAQFVMAEGDSVRIGVDVSGGYDGSDNSVIVRMVGNTIQKIDVIKNDMMHGEIPDEYLAKILIEYINDDYYPCRAKDIVIDTSGLGAGLWSVMKSYGYVCSRFYGNERVKSARGKAEKFKNRRAAEYWGLRELLKRGRLRISTDLNEYDKLCLELQGFRYLQDADIITLEEKKKTRNRIGHSPDLADALMLATCSIARVRSHLPGGGKNIDITMPKIYT